MNPWTVLVADIGGTHARFALARPGTESPLVPDSTARFRVDAFASLADAALHYLDGRDDQVRSAVLAVAGRVTGDEARITNHPWVISAERIRRALALDHVHLVNDFAAQAMAVPLLGANDVTRIGSAEWTLRGEYPRVPQRDFTYAVIGPGTGLGVGALLRREGRLHALQTEGGHASFAPGTPEEIAVLQRLSGEFGRVSNERIVSGGGLVNLHRALSAIAGGEALGERPGPLRPEDVTARARDGDPRCLHVIDTFCAVFGAAAGDLVLTLGAWDGVFLTGGVVNHVMPWLAHSGFRQRFEHKGRFAPAMASVPTLAVSHPQPGLLGAANLARYLHE